jgi:hypothetical protein
MKTNSNYLYLLALGFLLLMSCEKEVEGLGQERDKVKVLFLNSAPNAAATSVLADREIAIYPYYNGVQFNNHPIKYSHPNGYKAFVPGQMTIQLDTAQSQANNRPGSAAKVAEITFDTQADEYYSVFAVNSVQNVEIVLLQDDITTAVEAGKAKVRIMNFSSDAGPVDVVITKRGVGAGPKVDLSTPQVLASQLDFKGVIDFFEIEPGTYDMQIRDGATVLSTFTNMSIDDRSYYSIWVSGFRTVPYGGTAKFNQGLNLFYHANRWSNPFVQ